MVEEAVVHEAVRDLGPASTREIAEAVGCSPRAAEYRLRTLYADGVIDTKTVGNTLIWLPNVADDSTIGRIR